MKSKAPGLLSCTQLAKDITTCQKTYGKKVLLSIGGATSRISFPSATSASTFATTLWKLFGPPGSVDTGLRPFGTVQIDGFDVGAYFCPRLEERKTMILMTAENRQRGQHLCTLGCLRQNSPHLFRSHEIKNLLPLLCTPVSLPRRIKPTSPPPPLRFRLGTVLQQSAMPDRFVRLQCLHQAMVECPRTIDDGCQASDVPRCSGFQGGR